MSYGNRSNESYGRGRDRSMDQGAKPVEAGKEYNVEVTELSRRGDGIAKIQGFVIFVKGSKMGDKVKIKVETVGPRFATATAIGAQADAGSASSSTSSPSVTEPV